MFGSVHKGRLLLAAFISFIIWITLNEYFFCPSYSFDVPTPFSGRSFYNPYQFSSTHHWVKCNFHAHTNAWFGFTHGKGTAADVCRIYDSMHYGIHCVSDYQSINRSNAYTGCYIPAYEHGYNVGKTHQLVLGSNEVKWIDYLWPQTIDNKQNVLNNLTTPDDVVIVNHPLSFHSYEASDFRYLSNYNCMEVLSPYAISTACWDTALSNGRAVFIAGNDDEHNIFSKNSVGRMCTFLNLDTIDRKSALNALKNGEGYGVIIGKREGELPKLNSLKLFGDTIKLSMNELAMQISFVGQNGELLKKDCNTATAWYVIKPGDHYVREVIDFALGTSIFLNPVFRYDPVHTASASYHVNSFVTNVKRMSGLLLFMIWLRLAFPFIFLKRPRWVSTLKPFAFQ